MALKNKWVNYITRSYQQVKDSIVSSLVTSNPEVTDHSESNILIVIIDMFAGVTEMLNYYIDNMAREAFIATARKFTSMVKLVKILDYRIKAAYPSTVDLVFSFNTGLTSAGVIPLGTIVKTANNIPFVTIDNLNLAIGATSGIIGAKQITTQLSQNLGTTNGTANEPFSLGNSYVDSSANVKVDSDLYSLVNSFGLHGPTEKVFIVEIDVDGLAYVIFGNGINGIIPPSGKVVIADYDVTTASLGNVNANTINTIQSTLTLPGVATITVNNPFPSSGGTLYENTERIRVNAPLSIRTLDRAVTRQDYIDITRQHAGVGRADVLFNCGKTVYIYIIPEGGGIAQSPLLISVFNWLTERKMLTTFIEVLPAGETNIGLVLDVTAKYRADVIQTANDVINALVDFGSFNKQNINKKIRLSDIIALVDNLDKVEFVDPIALFTKPYARPISTSVPLVWVSKSLPGSLVKSLWQIEYIGGINFNITKNGIFMGTTTLSTLWTDPDNIIQFTINASPYVVGNSWTFTVYPYNKNIEFDDFTMPKISASDLTINIIPQLIPPIE